MKTLIFFFLSLSLSIAQAQTVSISSEPAQVEYYRMPDYPLPSGYKTYSAELDIPFTELSKSGFTKSYLIDTYLALEGYKRVNSSADVAITATIGEFFIWSESRNTNRTKTKDKDGNERVKYTYSLQLKYSMPVAIQVKDRGSKTLLDEYIFSMSDTRSWTSSTYNTIADLDSYWRIQRPTRLADLQKDLTKEGMNKIFDLINDSYGYRRIKDKIRFATLSKKNHPDYPKFQKHVEIMQSAFDLMDADQSVDAVREKATPALTFYAETADRYHTGNKDQKKLKHVCLYNQALAYFWLEDFDQAESLAKSIQKFDTKNKDVRRLLDEIEYTRASLYNAGRSSRHGLSEK